MIRSWLNRMSIVFSGLLLATALMNTAPAQAQSWPKIQSSPDATKVLDTFKRGPYQHIASGRIARETLVSGMYALLDPSGKYAPLFVDADNTRLKNGSSPWIDIASGNNLNTAQTLALKQEMAQKLKTNSAIPFQYGSGNTKAIMVSAYDCPYCQQLEKALDAANIDATIYVFPMSLQTNRAGPMDIARNIWCNNQNEAAWKAMTLSKQAPEQALASCDKDARHTTELMSLFDIKAVPARIHPNGRITSFKASDF